MANCGNVSRIFSATACVSWDGSRILRAAPAASSDFRNGSSTVSSSLPRVPVPTVSSSTAQRSAIVCHSVPAICSNAQPNGIFFVPSGVQ